ncbi:tetratricopeptide repeat protein [Chloroflexota bacterium]
MSYQDDRQVGLKRERSKQAIALAMQGRWKEAIAVNQDIVENFPHDVDAYNRLGKAYMELGEYLTAKEAYNQAIEIEPYNAIARKNLDRLSRLGAGQAGVAADTGEVKHQQFIEEAGKAGVVKLYHLAPVEILARVMAGDRVKLKVDDPNLVVEDALGQYLGRVEPRHGQRLARLIQAGNEYSAAIISSAEDKVSVIIREIQQDPSQSGQVSFPPMGVTALPPEVSGRVPRPGLEDEDEGSESSGYTIVGGDEAGTLVEDHLDSNEDQDNELNNEE